MTDSPSSSVPPWLVVAADYAWRIGIVTVVFGGLVFAATQISVVIVPTVVSVFAAAILEGIRRPLVNRGLSHQWSSTIAFVVGFLLLGTVITLAVGQIANNFDELSDQTQGGVAHISDALANSPLHLNLEGIEKSIDSAIQDLQKSPGDVLSGTFSVLATTGGLLAGSVLTIITTAFLMFDRQRIRNGLLQMVPPLSRTRADAAAVAAWQVLVSYVRVTLIEAGVTSVAIGTAAGLTRLPIAFALGAVVFLLAFVPIVGAVVSGLLVVLVALVTKGTTAAVIMAVVALIVQQLDANVLYPLLTSRRLSIHPLSSLMLVSIGGVIGGLFGAFIAVPFAAMAGAGLRVMTQQDVHDPSFSAIPD